MDNTQVCVVGGGPAGMMLGLLLARCDIDVTVLEKHGDFLRDFRGDTVHPSTLRLLDQLELGEEFAAIPHTKVQAIDSVSVADGRRAVLGDLTGLRTPHPYISLVPQWDFLNLLAEAGKREPRFDLRMSTECTGVIHRNGKVTGVRTSEGDIAAQLVVGTDGRWSTVRTSAGMRPYEIPTPSDSWIFRLEHPEERLGTLEARTLREQTLTATPRRDYVQLAYRAPKGLDNRLRTEGLDSFRERVRVLMPEFTEQLRGLETMDEVKHLSVRISRLRRWFGRGVLCIGDAAHAMSPMGGVGVNLAVQDAVATARILAKPLRDNKLSPRSLALVQARRYLPAVVVQGIQRAIESRTDHRGTSEIRGPWKTAVNFLSTRPTAMARLLAVGLQENPPPPARR
ncbi:FAD-dependent oxidoreductase [Sciscionella sediminilitoris]|uniref:FAD-dependent oxidoreductase n=1 Tax=Sciscionella sediminilitoris TaxID=1445613 RepID=UPI0004DF13F5|nr:FAD-dependent oxidoreductase [Sciscionella sp. SE31]